MSKSPLTEYEHISPFRNSPRSGTIRHIIVHHTAGVCSLEDFDRIVHTPGRNMSANYCIGSDGRVGLFCPEEDRCWCSSNRWADQNGCAIETSNSKYGGDWPVSDVVWNKLVDLCTDICQRNNIPKLIYTGDTNGTLLFHRFFAATACVPVDTTELLTPHGWVLLRDIRIGDLIATASPKDLSIRFSPVENIVPVYNTSVYSANGMSVTDGHRILHISDHKNGFQLEEFKNLMDTEYSVPSAGCGSSKGLAMSSSEMVFLLEAQRIGVINEEKETIDFTYIMESKGSYFDTLIHNIGFVHEKVHEDLGPVRFTISDKRAWDLVVKYLVGKDKDFTWDWLDMSPTQFSYFIYKVTSHEDGTWRRIYTSNSIMNINIIQALCAMNERGSYYDHENNALYVSEPFRRIDKTFTKQYNVDVSCVTTQSGCFLMRQNGYTTITGNCPGEYIFTRAQKLCDEVNAKLGQSTPTPEPYPGDVVTPVELKSGVLVSIKSGATYYTGSLIPTWVTKQRWYVESVNGDRVVINQNEAGNTFINSAVNAKYLEVVQNASAPPAKDEFKPYTIKLNAGTSVYKYLGGKLQESFKLKNTGVYTIVEENAFKNIKIGKLKSGAGWVKLGTISTDTDQTINVGDKVSVIKNETYDGKTFVVYVDSYTVLEVNGDRVVISSDGKNVTAAVKACNLKKL